MDDKQNDRVKMVYKIAAAKKWPEEEIDELVSEVYVFNDGQVMTCPIEQVFTTAKYAILHYHTDITGGTADWKRVKLSTQEAKKNIARPLQLRCPDSVMDNDTLLNEILLENKEFWDYCMDLCTEFEQNVLNRVLLYSETHAEAGRFLGKSHATVWQAKDKALKKIKRHLDLQDKLGAAHAKV